MSESSSSSRLLHLLGGPALLLLALALPIFGPIESRFGFGILFWMVWWWITCVVDIKLTCLVPIFVACVYSYMPLGKVLEAYVHREAVLIFGATAITCAERLVNIAAVFYRCAILSLQQQRCALDVDITLVVHH